MPYGRRFMSASGLVLQLRVLHDPVLAARCGARRSRLARRPVRTGRSRTSRQRRALLRAAGGQAHALLQLEQPEFDVLLRRLEALELLLEGVDAQRLRDFGGRQRAALGLLDLLRHALERLERGAIVEAGHRLVNALLRL